VNPEVGIHENVPFETYLSWDAISNSRLQMAKQSLAHFRANIAIEKTKPLQLGQLCHCGQLEPLSIALRYCVMPDFHLSPENIAKDGSQSSSKSTAYYREKSAAFRAANKGKEFVDEAQYKLMVGVVEAIAEHQRASSYLRSRGPVELSIAWVDDETGLLCKARLDKVSILARLIVDLKTTMDASRFSSAIAEYGYYNQMPHYVDGWRVLTGEEYGAAFVAVESKPIHGVRAAPLGQEFMDAGRAENRRLLRDIADAKESGDWPCYEDPKEWVPPHWFGAGADPVELVVGGEVISI